MATVTFKGTPYRISDGFPSVGHLAPAFLLTKEDLSDVGLDAWTGKVKILSIVPSLDTSVCALSARKFDEAIARLPGTVLLNISMDLPFAQSRFCHSEHLQNIVTLSAFRSPRFGEDYGVRILEGPLAGLLARAVLVLSRDNIVTYAQLVPAIEQEPDYAAALEAAQATLAGTG